VQLSRSFAEKSSYHKMQMLGKGTTNKIPLKKPKMKEGFISKAEVDRLNAKKAEATPTKATKNFFNPPPVDTLANEKDARVTNTMTYSDTQYNQTSSAIAGRKTDMSDLGTVFGLGGTQRNTLNRDIEIDCEMQKSAHFGPSRESADHGNLGGSSDTPERTNFMSSRNEAVEPKTQDLALTESLQNTSQVLEFTHFQKEAAVRSQKLPYYQASWFHFFTNTVYCCVTSLRLQIAGALYKIPFAIAKLILTSRHRFESFISTTKFESGGIFEIDFKFIESIKGERIENYNYFTEDSHLDVGNRRIGLQ
jgi:hypothetical protein